MKTPTRLLVGLVVAAALNGCSSDDGQDQSRAPAPALDPASTGRMQIEQRAYEPGDRVSVRWPSEDLRGVAYSLDLWTGQEWDTRYYIGATKKPTSSPAWWDADEKGRGWPDIGIGGPGPDLAVVPDTAESGTYRLCTANARRQSCALLTVT